MKTIVTRQNGLPTTFCYNRQCDVILFTCIRASTTYLHARAVMTGGGNLANFARNHGHH